jgi:predicted MFS family arabinose efflux permease
LTFGIALGIGPVLGGYLYDHIAPGAIWIGGMSLSALALLGFLFLNSATQYNGKRTA